MSKKKEKEDIKELQNLRKRVESKLDESNVQVEKKLSHLKASISNFLSDYDNSQKYHDQLVTILTKIDEKLGITCDDEDDDEDYEE